MGNQEHVHKLGYRTNQDIQKSHLNLERLTGHPSNLHSKTTERKFVIGKNKKEFAIIEKYGMVNLSEVQLMDMVKKYLCKSE